MRIFHCDRCGVVVAFGAQSCPACGATIGYVSDEGGPCSVVPTADPVVFRLDRDGWFAGPRMWRCLNWAWGCNWMLPVDSDGTRCRSCRLTRGRPDVGQADAMEAWMLAEAATRRLVHQLDELALPIDAMSDSAADGLVFDLAYLPGEGGISGHLNDVVTLDLAEAVELHRRQLRRQMGEPIRTLIGHLRHEVGHHYWDRLVGQTDDLRRFRLLFGDDRDDDAPAIGRCYAHAHGAWDRTRFVTAYAAASPLEDWAETFAHYLHVLAAVDAAVAHGLVPVGSSASSTTDAVGAVEFSDLLDAWRPLQRAVNAIAESVGEPAVYPLEFAGAVIDKLAFVHGQVAAHVERDRFYTDV